MAVYKKLTSTQQGEVKSKKVKGRESIHDRNRSGYVKISAKADFGAKITRDDEGHRTMTKGQRVRKTQF